MNFTFLNPEEYPGQEILVIFYNLTLLFFMWDVAKYILGIVKQRIQHIAKGGKS